MLDSLMWYRCTYTDSEPFRPTDELTASVKFTLSLYLTGPGGFGISYNHVVSPLLDTTTTIISILCSVLALRAQPKLLLQPYAQSHCH